MKISILIFGIAILGSSCSKDVKIRFQAPDDEISMVCEHGKLGKVNVTCGDYENFASKKFSKPGLIVLLEVGTFEANRGMGSENPFSAMLNSGALASYEGVQPHIRSLLHNLFIAFVEKTLEAEKRNYDQVYIAHLPKVTDRGLRDKFFAALSAATKAHSKVDIVMVGHGLAGKILLTPTLDRESGQNLTAQQLVKVTSEKLTLSERKKIRAIFQTHCYGAKKNTAAPVNHARSIYEAYGKSFPNAQFYGSVGINTFPLHRDLVMFEKFYNTQDFKLAHRVAVRVMKSTPHNKEDRTRIVYPSIRGRGCVDLFFTDKCENKTFSTAIIGSKDTIDKLINSSLPIYGNASLAENF